MRKKNMRARELPCASIKRERQAGGGPEVWVGKAVKLGMVFTAVDYSYDIIKSWARKFGKRRKRGQA